MISLDGTTASLDSFLSLGQHEYGMVALLSDPSGKMAFGVCTLTEHVEEKLLARLVSLAKEKEAETVESICWPEG